MDAELILRVATYLRDREVVIGKIIEGLDEAYFGNAKTRREAIEDVAESMTEGQIISTDSGPIQCVPEGSIQWKPAKEQKRVKRIKYLKNYGGTDVNTR